MSLSQQLWKSLPCRLICNAKGSECMKEAKTNSDKIVACSRETLDCERKNCTAKAPVNVPEWCDINTGQVKPGHQAPVR